MSTCRLWIISDHWLYISDRYDIYSLTSVHTWLGRYRQEGIAGQFLGGWLARDPIRLGPSLEDFVTYLPRHRAAGPGPGPLRLPARRRQPVPVRPGRGGVRPGTAASPLRGPRTPQATIHTAAINEWLCQDLLNTPWLLFALVHAMSQELSSG